MPEVASQTFELVGREVNVTLAAARAALESYVEQPDNAAFLEQCAQDLHQVQGVLRMLEIYGAALLADWGIDVSQHRTRRRRFACTCPDWSERRPHLGGALGAALLDSWSAHGWVERTDRPRILRVTPTGHRHFDAFLAH